YLQKKFLVCSVGIPTQFFISPKNHKISGAAPRRHSFSGFGSKGISSLYTKKVFIKLKKRNQSCGTVKS
ncbi:MAG: hypothetical protein ACK56L_14285, partial [Pseudanabaena sp.]